MPFRLLRPLIVSVVPLARNPVTRAGFALACALVPGLRPLLRRAFASPAPVPAPPSALMVIEAMLALDRSRVDPVQGGTVTVEQLCQLARTP